MKTAFMVIDYQNDFVYPEKGTLYVKWAERLEQTIIDLIRLFGEKWAYMIWTQDWHPENTKYFAESLVVPPYTQLKDGTIAWPRHCVANTFGAEFYGRVKSFKPDLLVRKGQTADYENYSAFDKDEKWVQILEKIWDTYKPLSWWNLVEILKEKWIGKIYMVWVATDFCVNEVVLVAIKEWFEVEVFENAIKEVFPENKKKIFENWKKQGVKIV